MKKEKDAKEKGDKELIEKLQSKTKSQMKQNQMLGQVQGTLETKVKSMGKEILYCKDENFSL